MGGPTAENLLDRCVEFHGHLCLGQALGVRLALKGMELIGTRDPRRMVVFIENERCIADAIQIVTGTRIGRRSAKLVNYGKMAATFVNIESGQAYRVSVRHVDPGLGHSRQAVGQVLAAADAELLAWKPVAVVVRPEDLPGKTQHTVVCVRCNEKVFDRREVQTDDGPVCLSCAQGAYYQLVGTGP